MDPLSPGPRKPLWSALQKVWLVSLGLTAPAAGSLAEPATQWDCRGDGEGQWVCREREVDLPYARPQRQPQARPSSPEEPRLTVTPNLDWVPMEQLSEAEKALVRPNCCGAYIEPNRDYENADQAPAKSPLQVGADSTEAQGDVAVLKGDVQVTQGYRQVRSNRARVNRAERTVKLDGNVTFREPGVLMTSESADVNFDTGQLQVGDAEFVLHDSGVRGKAAQLDRPDENTIYVHDATYTSCQPNNNAWALRASSVRIDTVKNIATARHVRLNVRDWPVLYLPWIRYPTSDNRATGLLFPSVLTGNDNGIDFAQPIYLNLAPQFDATVTPRYLQERGAMGELELRHLSRWTETRVSGAFLPDDDGGSNRDAEDVGQDRWTVNLDHRGGMGYRWNTRIDYTDVSDNDYFRDIDSASLEVASTSHLNQQVKVGYDTAHWEFAAQGQQYETIIDNGLEQYKQLPRVDANGRYRLGASDLVLSLRQHFVRFDHAEDDVSGSGTVFNKDIQDTAITGSRVRADYSLAWDKEWLWGFFRPEVAGKYIGYELEDPLLGQSEETPEVLVPVASLDTGLFFERDAPWLSNHIQTFEPRIYYLYSGYEDQSAIPNFDTSELTFSYQQLFREDRFSGGDRVGDTEQITLGITSRFIDAATGREKLRFSIGQIHYLKNRRVSLTPFDREDLGRDSSDIALELSARFLSHWRWQADLLTDEDEGRINKGSFALRYNDDSDNLFNLAYRYTRRQNVLTPNNQFRRADIDQADLSFSLPLAESWRVLGRYNHDLRTGRELEVFAGLEYASCCWRASVIARRWIDRDDRHFIDSSEMGHNNGIFFQIQFRGLAGTGDRVDNILSEGIYGYQPPED